jgi:hypothetical protein
MVTGGQCGADQGALIAARAAGVETDGWAPLGWATEDGPAPWLASFGLVEHPVAGYPARTRANVRDSHLTLWFGRVGTPGHQATIRECRSLGRPFLEVEAGLTRPKHVAEWLAIHPTLNVLNCAGNRESLDPGICDRTAAFLIRVFGMLERYGRL